jgi:hypothetical protein
LSAALLFFFVCVSIRGRTAKFGSGPRGGIAEFGSGKTENKNIPKNFLQTHENCFAKFKFD